MSSGSRSTFIQVPLRDLFAFIIRGLPLALLFAAIGMAAAWWTVQRRPDSFTAVAHLLSVRQEFAPTAVRGIVPGSLDPALYRAAVSNGPVLDAVRSNWTSFAELPSDREILQNLQVVSDNQLRSSVIRVVYTTASPLEAAEVATAVARELVAWDFERTRRPLRAWTEQLNSELAALEAAADPELTVQRDQLVRELATLQATVPLSQLSLLSEAAVPEQRDGTGLVTGMGLAIVIAILLAYLLRLARLALRSPTGPTPA